MLFKFSILVLALSFSSFLDAASLPSSCLTQLQKGLQETINKKRVCHGKCVALALNTELNGLAQKWATYLASIQDMDHNPKRATATLCKSPSTSADNYCGKISLFLIFAALFGEMATSIWGVREIL